MTHNTISLHATTTSNCMGIIDSETKLHEIKSHFYSMQLCCTIYFGSCIQPSCVVCNGQQLCHCASAQPAECPGGPVVALSMEQSVVDSRTPKAVQFSPGYH